MEFILSEALEQLPAVLEGVGLGNIAPPPLTMDQVTNVLGDTGGLSFLDSTNDMETPGPSNIRPQVEPTSAGEPISESSKEVNTIITVDSTTCKSEKFSTTTSAHSQAASSEPFHDFPFIGRWINYDVISVNPNPMGTLMKKYDVPIDFLSKVTCATNLSPFESFANVIPNLEVQFSVNGLRSMSGKIFAFFVLDAYDFPTLTNDDWPLALVYPHVELDLCSRNAGILDIGFNYFESMLQIHARRGKVTANFGTIYVYSFGLQTGTINVPNVQCVVKYRFKNTKFAGITSRKEIDTVGEIPPHPYEPEGEVGYDTVEMNTSKYSVVQTFPATRFDFSTGGSGSNLIHQMRLNPNRLTISKSNLETNKSTISSIISEWGPIGVFDWDNSQPAQTTLLEILVDPARLCYGGNLITLKGGVYCPLVYCSNFMQFFTGPMDIKFKFVSNEFTTGEAMISTAFGRDDVSTSYCQANSGYSKYIVIGKDREFDYTIPYIDVNPWKRTRVLNRFINSTVGEGSAAYYDGAARNTVWQQNQVFLRVNVVSSLRAPDGSPSKVRCIVMARAAPGFQLAVPCMSNIYLGNDYNKPIEAYPRFNFNGHVNPETGEEPKPPNPMIFMPRAAFEIKKDRPTFDTPEMNPPCFDQVEINPSSTEVEDVTMNFNPGHRVKLMTAEDHDSVLSLMQRPVLVFSNCTVRNNPSGTLPKDQKAYWLPLTPNPEVYEGLETCDFNESVHNSLYFALLSMYRYWRGSLRFILVFEKTNENLLILQLIANSGVFKVGEFFQYDQTVQAAPGNNYHDGVKFYGNGLAELKIDLTKQKIVTIEVPYYRESNWCRTVFKTNLSTGGNTRNSTNTFYPADIASFVSGHLVVWSEGNYTSDAKFSLYIQPGDDFQLAGYRTAFPVPYPIVDNNDLRVVTDDQPTSVKAATTKTHTKVNECRCHGNRPEFFSEEEAVREIKEFMLSLNCRKMSKLPNLSLPKKLLLSREYILKKQINVFTYEPKQKPGVIRSTVAGIGNFIKDHPVATIMGAATAVSPLLGAGAMVAATASTTSDISDNVQENLNSMREHVNDTTTMVNQNISVLSRSLGTTIDVVRSNIESVSAFTRQSIDKTTDMFSKLYDQIKSVITPITNKISNFFNIEVDVSDFFFDFVNLIINCNYKTFALVICKFLVKFKILTIEAVSSMSNFVQKYAKRIFGNSTVDSFDHTEADFTLQQEEVSNEDKDFYSTLCGLFIGIVSASVGVVLSPTKYESLGFIKGVVLQTCSSGFWSVVRSATVIMKNLIQCMVNCYKWITRKLFKDADYAITFEEKAKFIEVFCTEAQEYCRVINARNITTIPEKKKKFLEILMKAMYIKTLIVKSEDKNLIKNVPALLSLCNQVIKTFDDYSPIMRTGIVGYNSFVICVQGEPGLGKSFITDEIATACLKKAKIPIYQPDIIFYENSLNKYSSGYQDQPVIAEDDWCAVKSEDAITKSLAMLISLSSPAPYRPVQAEINEKKNLANPPIYYINCNNAFPNIEPVVQTPEAIWRRRNILVTMKRNGPIPIVNDNNPIDRTYPGLTFQLHENGAAREPSGPIMNFLAFRDLVAERFATYNEQEKMKIKHRFQILMDCIPNGNEQIFLDPFSVLHEYNAVDLIDENKEELPLTRICQNVRDVVMRIHNESVPSTSASEDRVETTYLSVSSFAKQIATNIVKRVYTKCFRVDPMYFKCNICMSSKRFIFVKCSNGGTEDNHGVCYECYSTMVTKKQFDRDEDNSLVPKCAMCRTGTYIHAVDKNVEHYVCSLLGNAMDLLELDGGDSIRKFHLIHSTQDWLWNVLGAIFWLTSINNIDEESVVGFPLAMIGLFGYFQEAYLACKNFIWRMFDTPEFDPDDYPNIDISTPVTGELIHVPLKESIICKHQACTKRTAANFQIMISHHGEIVVMDSFTHQISEGTQIQFNVGDSLPLEYCSLNCPFYVKSNVVSFIKHIIQADIIFGYKLNRALSDPQANVPRWLCAIDDSSDHHEEIARIAQLSRDELKKLVSEPWYMRVYHFVTDHWKGILIGVGIVSSCIFAYCSWVNCAVGLMNLCKSDTPELRYEETNIPRGMNIQRITLPTRDLGHSITIRPEINDHVLQDVVQNKIIRNTLFIAYGGTKARAIGISGRIAVIPKHYIYFFEQAMLNSLDHVCTITNWNGSINRKYKLSDLVVDTTITGDLALMTMPLEIPQFANIVKYMPPEEKARAAIFRPRINMVRVETKYIKVQDMKAKGLHKCNYEGVFKDLVINDCLYYDFHGLGECGNVIMQEDGQHPIIGLHVGGNRERGEGFAELLHQGLFLDLVKERNDLTAEFSPGFVEKLQGLEKSKVWFPDQVEINYIGTVEPEMTPFMPKKSKLKPSLVSETLIQFSEHTPVPIPNRHQPAILTKEDPRWTDPLSPLVKGAAMYGKVTDTPNLDSLQIAKAWVRAWMFETVKPLRTNTRDITLEETITGIQNLEHYDGLDLNTSAGWPFNQVNGMTKKKDWIDVTRDDDGNILSVKIHPKVLSVIEHQDKQCENGIIPVDVFENHLKDEKRTNLTKTRVFCLAPINSSMRVAQQFMDFKAAFTQARLNAGHAIGINCNSDEWRDLYDMMIEYNDGKNIINLDYENFGPGFNINFGAAAWEVINDWMDFHFPSEIMSKRRHMTAKQFQQCFHLVVNLIIQQICGSASGGGMTTPINTVTNLIHVAYTYVEACKKYKKNEFLNYRSFRRVKVVTYGDDILMSVPDEFKEWFNQNVMKEILSECKIVVTDAFKSVNMPDFYDIHEVEFLKRGFSPGIYKGRRVVYCPLNIDSVTSCAHWVKDDINMEEATRVNCETALRLAADHGKDYYDDFSATIDFALLLNDMNPIGLSWMEIMDNYYAK